MYDILRSRLEAAGVGNEPADRDRARSSEIPLPPSRGADDELDDDEQGDARATPTPSSSEWIKGRIDATPGFLPHQPPLPADAPADEAGDRMVSLAALRQAGRDERVEFERQFRERRR